MRDLDSYFNDLDEDKDFCAYCKRQLPGKSRYCSYVLGKMLMYCGPDCFNRARDMMNHGNN